MKPTLLFVDKILDETNDTAGCIYDTAIKPQGSEILFAIDTRIVVYSMDGTLLKSLRGHKDLVYALAWAHNGEMFASGSADKNVFVWSENHEPTFKYSLTDAIQRLAFSPSSTILLSCGVSDYGLWTNTDKSVSRQKVLSRCCSCAWNYDGTIFAIGFGDGTVQIRKTNQVVEDAVEIRHGTEPVWALAISSYRFVNDKAEDSVTEIICAGDWDKKIGFYDFEGKSILPRTKDIGYEPYCMQYFNNGQFLMIGGSNKQLQMYTKLGQPLGVVSQMDSWVWSGSCRAQDSVIAMGCVDGTVAAYQLFFSTVHGFNQEKYAWRNNMTEVVVQNLADSVSTKIKCAELVSKVALYGNKVAVQFDNKIHIYKQSSAEGHGLEYKLADKIMKIPNLDIMMISSQHVLGCLRNSLLCFDQKGMKQREWMFSSHVIFIKVVGGPPGRETVLLGLTDGLVAKVFVDNPFSIDLIRLNSAVRCIDFNCDRSLIATIDSQMVLKIFDVETLNLLFQEPHCQTVSFSTEYKNLFAYSGQNQVTVRNLGYTGHTQKMMGIVVGFTKNRVYCLHMYTMGIFEIPVAIHVFQLMEARKLTEAYELATLGMAEDDWHTLGTAAIHFDNLDIAKKCFGRTKDYRYLQLLAEIDEMRANNESEVLVKGHILSYAGKFREAAQLYRDNNMENKAMELFTDLRMFEDAQEVMALASGETQKELMRKRANWATESNQPKIAAEMLISSGDLDKATQLIIDNDWMDLAIDIMRRLDTTDVETVKKLAVYFTYKKEFGLSSKLYSSINDIKSIVDMHVGAHHWTDAFAIADRFPKFTEDVYLPYARHLAENDKFEQAQWAFHKAGRESEALNVLETLTSNAVNECRFGDAGYYFWLLSMQYLDQGVENYSYIEKHKHAENLAEIYFAYENVHQFCIQPFSKHSQETIFNFARFVAFHLPIANVSQVYTYYTIARVGVSMGAFKTAREALEKLSKLRLPADIETQIEIMTLNIRAKPFSDSELLLPMCYRCGLNTTVLSGGACIHCKTPFVYSFADFDILPLVEFWIEDSIEPDEAQQLLFAEPPLGDANFDPIHSRKKEVKVVLKREELARLEHGQVITLKLRPPLLPRYFYNVVPTINISQCDSCHKLFQLDDFEMSVLQFGFCPFCRTAQQRVNGVQFDDDDEDNM